jgi:hypothetical protein
MDDPVADIAIAVVAAIVYALMAWANLHHS